MWIDQLKMSVGSTELPHLNLPHLYQRPASMQVEAVEPALSAMSIVLRVEVGIKPVSAVTWDGKMKSIAHRMLG